MPHCGVHSEQIDSSLVRKSLSRKPGHDRILVVISALLFYCGCYFAKSTLPLHIKGLNGSDAVVGRTIAVMSGAALATRWIAGALQDKYGSKPFMVGCSLCLACATLSYRFISSIPLLTVSAFFQGIALGGFATTAVAQIVGGIQSEIERTSALSLFSMSHLTAGAIAPWLALTMATHMETSTILGWATVGGLAAVLPALRVSSLPPKTEKHANTASSRPNVFRDKVFVGASLCYLVWAISYGAIYSFLPLFGQERGIINVGVFFTSFAMINLIGRVFVRHLVLRMGAARLINISSFLVIISMCLLSISRSPFHLAVAGVIYGLGSTGIYPCLAGIATGRGSGNTGMIVALFMSNFELGQMFGSIALGSIISRRGYPAIYRISAIAMFVGLLIFNRMAKPVVAANRETV